MGVIVGRADGGKRKTIPPGVSIGTIIRGQTNELVDTSPCF
jgi:hypothetical protein